MAQQFQFQAPQTDINASFARLAQANSQRHERDLQAQQIKNENDTNTFSNYVGIAGAAVAGIYSGGNPAAISAGYSIGKNVGVGLKGGRANAGEVASAGATLYGVDNDQAQTEAERQQLVAMRNQSDQARTANMAGDDIDPSGVPQTAQDRYINPALKSPTPFKTAMAGIQIANALAPQQTKEISYGDNSTALVTMDAMGHIDKVIGNDKGAKPVADKGEPRNVWLNDGDPDSPKWRQVVATSTNQVQDLQTKYGMDRMSLTDPQKENAGEPRQAWTRPDADSPWTARTATTNRDVSGLVSKFGAENVVLKDPNGGENGGTKEFQTFSPQAMDNPTFLKLIKTKGAKVEPQIMNSLTNGGVVDLSTLAQQINASPEEIEQTKLGVIQDELKGNRWNDDAKAAARAYLKDNVDRRTEDRINFVTNSAATGAAMNFDNLRKGVDSMQYVDKKKLTDSIDQIERGQQEAGAKESSNQDALFQKGLDKLPPSQQKDLKKLPPGQREKVLDKMLGEKAQQQDRAEQYIDAQKDKGKLSDAAIRSNALRIMGPYFKEDERQSILANKGLRKPEETAAQ